MTCNETDGAENFDNDAATDRLDPTWKTQVDLSRLDRPDSQVHLWPTRVHGTCSMTAISCCRCIQLPMTLERPWLCVFIRSGCTMSAGCDVHHLVVVVSVLAMLVTRRRCSETIASASAATVAIVLVVLAACRLSFVQPAVAPSSSSLAAVHRRVSIGFSHVSL